MFDYLLDHAIKNVWCTPNQDMQSITRLAKLTGFGGVWNKVRVLWRTLTLPEQSTRFHVYQIGQLFPSLMGLLESDNVWTTFATACSRESLIVDIYDKNGVQLPRHQVWYMVTADKDLIVAIKEQKKIPIDLNTSEIFLRVYSNAYYASKQSDPLNDYIEVNGKTIRNTDDVLELQTKIANLSKLPGAVYSFINGYKTAGIDLLNTAVGDVAEYVYDSSIYKVVDLPISELQTFTSKLDSKNKYLIHYSDNNLDNINYQDDVDFFIVEKDAQLRHKGIYYHRNQEDSVRMLTHKDYSLVVPYVAGYLTSVPTWTNIQNLTIRLHIRKSGYTRSLIKENNRILELYKLPETRLVNALLGVNSNIPNWTAAELENSAYAKLMRANLSNITRQLTEDAYGYNTISKLIADTPKFTTDSSSSQVVQLPYNLINNSTVYEYDSEGVLLDFFSHPYGTEYVAWINACRQVEIFTGMATKLIDDVYGDVSIVLDPSLEYRMYACPIKNGIPTSRWADVSNDKSYYSIDANRKFVWNVDHGSEYVLIRSNKNILGYNIDLMADDGLLLFSLQQDVSINSVKTTRVMTLPMGELDLFLNGRSLIEGVDYFVKFPVIAIVNKSYLNDPLNKKQRVTVRFSGFCNTDLSRNKTNDSGFIEQGILSHNNRFDIRDDKVLRIVVDGKLYDRSELKFSETNPSVSVLDVNNGVPYAIRDIVVPLRGLAVSDTYECRSKSLVIDKLVSDYMTLWAPETPLTSNNVIRKMYEVFSPFCCKIIYDLKAGILDDPILKNTYNDSKVMELCKEYEHLLELDPINSDLTPNSNYVTIHPHNLQTVINIDIYSYKFLTRVVKIYMHGLVDISYFINVSVY